jgi:hypothetical protein
MTGPQFNRYRDRPLFAASVLRALIAAGGARWVRR